MKSITLDEVAYQRLKAWKQDSKESFSSVVKRVVPVHGTLGAFLSFLEANPTADPDRDDVMEQTIQERSTVKSKDLT